MTEVSAKLFDALERISEAKTDDEFLAAANHLAALRRELIANDVSGKEAKYPAGLPKKYWPVANELTRMGYRCDSCRNNQADFARITLDAVAKNGDIEIVALYDKVCGIGFDILDTPWWASVQKRKEQEFQAAVNERCEQMRAMQRDIKAATEMHDVPLDKKPDDELMRVAKEQNVVAEEVERLFGAIRNLVVENRDLRRRMEGLEKYTADTLSLAAQAMRKKS